MGDGLRSLFPLPSGERVGVRGKEKISLGEWTRVRVSWESAGWETLPSCGKLARPKKDAEDVGPEVDGGRRQG